MIVRKFFKSLCFAGGLLSAVGLLTSAHAVDIQALKEDYVRPTDIPFPDDNPYTEAKAELGKTLYFDPRMSASGTQSCGTCHNPSFDWEDGMATGTGHGHEKLGRASPTILNLAWDEVFMWDGRAESLEEQALGPIQADVEMNMPMGLLLDTLKGIEGYQPLFAAAFPENPEISDENIGKAIATFERTVVSGEAPFDAWIKGDETAISDSAKRGFVLYNGKANCAACHAGWNFSDNSFHDIGIDDADIGVGKFLPDVVPMQQAFKTVGLRNIDRRAPYMHNGVYTTLEEVIDHYDSGFVKRVSLSDEIKPLGLTSAEKKDLVAFLHSLTSEDAPVTLPILPR